MAVVAEAAHLAAMTLVLREAVAVAVVVKVVFRKLLRKALLLAQMDSAVAVVAEQDTSQQLQGKRLQVRLGVVVSL